MTPTAVTVDIHQTLDVEAHFRSELTFNFVIVLDNVTDRDTLVLVQVLDPGTFVDASLPADLLRRCPADAKDIRQTHYDPFIVRDINARDTCHLPSLLLVVMANH
jgi:sensor domain CHASE-containing protein